MGHKNRWRKAAALIKQGSAPFPALRWCLVFMGAFGLLYGLNGVGAPHEALRIVYYTVTIWPILTLVWWVCTKMLTIEGVQFRGLLPTIFRVHNLFFIALGIAITITALGGLDAVVENARAGSWRG